MALLRAPERSAFAALAAVSLLVGLVEALGVLSVVPFIALAGDPGALARSDRLAALQAWSGLSDPDDFLIALGLGCFGVLCLAVALRTAAFYLMARFVRRQSVTLAARVLARHLARPGTWHRRRSSADLAALVLSEVRDVVDGSLLNLMRLMANGAVALCLVLLLLAVEPAAALVMTGLLALGYGSVFVATRRRIAAMGAARLAARRDTYRTLQEAGEALKTIKTLHLEDRYVARFEGPARRAASMHARIELLRDVPRGVLEALTFGGMLLLTVYGLSRAGDLRAALPVLAIYAVAGARLFPVLQKLYRAAAALRAHGPALEALHESLEGERAEAPGPADAAGPPLRLRRALALEEVTVRFAPASGPASGPAPAPVLDAVSLHVEAGATLVLTGPSGAGKSTVLDVVLGLVEPDAGRVTVDGVPLGPKTRRRWQRSVGYVPQTAYVADASLAENIAFGVPTGAIDRDAVARAGRIAGLGALAASRPGGYDAPAGPRGANLSGGEAQRLAIARALYRDPDVLVLDEPTSALDPDTERAVIDALEALRGRKTVILVTHAPEAARGPATMARMAGGRVVSVRPVRPGPERDADRGAEHGVPAA